MSGISPLIQTSPCKSVRAWEHLPGVQKEVPHFGAELK
jgi:hypothetical protein